MEENLGQGLPLGCYRSSKCQLFPWLFSPLFPSTFTATEDAPGPLKETASQCNPVVTTGRLVTGG